MGSTVGGEKVDLDVFINALRQHTAYDLSDYSDRSLRRRVQKILDDEGFSFSDLIRRISSDVSYGELVVNRITVNTSELFRDPSVWLHLRGRMYPRFRSYSRINVWHAGCSMGQEVYSNAVLLNEMGLLDRSKLFASDINAEILKKAQRGLYRYRFNLSYIDNFEQVVNTNPLNYEEELSVPFSKYFVIDKERDTIEVRPFLRELPLFRRNDLVRVTNPFFVKYDVVFCRNVIIYFNSQLQNRLFEMFYRNMYPGGVLILGSHESILGPWADHFTRVGPVYLRND